MDSNRHPLAHIQDIAHNDPDEATQYIPNLIEYLQQGSEEERDAASQVLGELAQRRPLEFVDQLAQLVDFLWSRDNRIRTNVSATFSFVAEADSNEIIRLERAVRTQIIDGLTNCILVGPGAARTNAAETIAHVAVVAPEVAVKAVDSEGFSKLFTGTDEQYRYAIVVCSQVVESDTGPVCKHIQHIREGIRTEYPTDERLAALATLGELAKESATLVANDIEPVLSVAEETNPEVRGNALAVAAIVAQKHPERVMKLRGLAAELLSSNSRPVRINSAELLYRLAESRPDRIRQEEIRRRLQDACKSDEEELVRVLAENTLEEVTEPSRSSDLSEIIQDIVQGGGLGAAIDDVADRMIINIEQMINEPHQNIKVADGSRVEGDVRNTWHQRPRSSQSKEQQKNQDDE